jgi:biotin carboxyl carrier protein
MALEFGLLMTLLGVVSVFSALAVVALSCMALKRFFKGQETLAPARLKITPPEKEVAAAGSRSFKIVLKGEEHEVKVEELGSAGKSFREVTPPSEMGEEVRVTVGQEEYKVKVEEVGEGAVLPSVKESVQAEKEIVSEEAKAVITAPMRGTIIKTLVRVGEKVEKGKAVAVLETMKMENTIESTVSGTVKAMYVSDGDSVDAGDALMVVD